MRICRGLILSLVLGAVGVDAAEYDYGDLRLETGAELQNLVTYTRRIQTERLLEEGSDRRGSSGLWLVRGRLWLEGAYEGGRDEQVDPMRLLS